MAERRRHGTGRRIYRAVRATLIRLTLAPIVFAFGILPWSLLRRLGAPVGRLLWARRPVERGRALDHLAIAFPDLGESEQVRLGRTSFGNIVVTLFEDMHLLFRGRAGILPHLELHGWEEVEALRAEGRRILYITGHIGNWELLAAALSLRGLPLYALVRQLNDPTLQRGIERLRRKLGAFPISRGTREAARMLRRVLRGEGALVLLIDQDTPEKGVFVPFFGRPANTPVGATQLALEHGFAVVPVFMERRHDGSHLCRIQPPLELPPDPLAATALMTEAIEDHIRQWPEQWVWWHRRWRRRPAEEAGEGEAPTVAVESGGRP